MPVTSASVRNCKTYFIGSIVCAGLIAYLSLIREPHFHLPPVSYADKWGHIAMYLVFAIVLMCEKVPVVYTCLVSIIYGGLMELLQHYFFPPRTGDWWDWLADGIGTLVGIAFFMMWTKLSPPKQQNHD